MDNSTDLKTSLHQRYDKLVLGIDPGTNVMGYGVLGVKGKTPELVVMGVLKLGRMENHYLKLHHIFTRVTALIRQYGPQELSIEAPFYGKNVQSMLKLGRAQGVAMAAALNFGMSITEYEPRKIKQSITGNGAASKEQVAAMLQRELNISDKQMPDLLDATDALAAAMCHFYESDKPRFAHGASSWKAFIAQHPDRVK